MSKGRYTKVEFTEFRKQPILSIFSYNKDTDEKSERPLISFGIGKAKAILNHIEEIKKFVEDEDR